MKKVITAENIRNFAYVNDAVCKRPIQGIVVEFMGLGGQAQHNNETDFGMEMGKHGILCVIPYLNPWAWMNPQAIRTTNEIIEAVLECCGLDALPIVSAGGSMGGQQALVYAAYAARTPAACVVNCPVCDLPYHYTERPDLPRTLYSAFSMVDAQTIEEAMEAHSPLHLAEKRLLPAVRYAFFHCEEDKAVNKRQHSDRLVEKLKVYAAVEYYAVPDRGHCDLTDEMRERYKSIIVNALTCGKEMCRA